MYKRLLCLIVIMAFTATAWTDDVLPPHWRGDPQFTMAQWTFDTAGFGWGWDGQTWEQLGTPEVSSGSPEFLGGNFEDVYSADSLWNIYDAVYNPTFAGRSGVWDAGAMAFSLEDVDEGWPFNAIRIQVTYYPGGAGWAAPEGAEIWAQISQEPWEIGNLYDLTGVGVTDPWGDLYVATPPITSVTHGDGWITAVWDVVIEPVPMSERISFGPWWSIEAGATDAGVVAHMYVDQVVIDTSGWPEPATVALLGLGSLALIRRKR